MRPLVLTRDAGQRPVVLHAAVRMVARDANEATDSPAASGGGSKDRMADTEQVGDALPAHFGSSLNTQARRQETPVSGQPALKTYGTVSAARRKEMTGLAFVQGLASGSLPLNTLARTLGYDVAEADHGRVVIVAEPNDTLLNPSGTIHGGFSASLLDSCMGLAIQSTLEAGVAQTTLEFKVSLVRAITVETGRLRAEGSVLTRGRRIGTAEGRIVDCDGRLLAHGTTTCLIFEG